ncbi:Beta-lactamase 3 precursor [Bacillus sp. THAF10]|uniref:class A beta-lactamase n=1 Tax=Bacillus sp. THAF10 TaxID=2587848 RepID=UPI0012A939CE|nr:class A beta-lactamase [Bacillus sp. THAF10]QFT88963.1 Beta-lactamase 3 precursor [Bacillus sp. THAF10]
MTLLTKIAGTLAVGALILVSCSNYEIEKEPKKEQETKIYFKELEKEYDAKLGVYALDTGSNRKVSYRADERFAYASTHKVLAVGVLLMNRTIDELNETIKYTKEDLVNYNPVTEKHVENGMTLKELSDASIRYSDNTAGNLILEAIGGPKGFKESLRKMGDHVTEPERMEPDLNDVKPGETRDTSSPKALAESLQAFTLGSVLPETKRNLLIDWLKRNTTGDNLIRAGVPKGWTVGDKTGGANGIRNDIAILWLPDGAPIILVVLSSHEKANSENVDELIAKATEEAVKQLQEK